MSLFTKVFGTHSQRELRKIEKIANKIEALADTYRAMSDAELRAVTDTLKNRLRAGETLDDILPDAFAAVREADQRVLGKRPFHVQLLGGIILHQGKIAEMKTGEGKTLVATMPAYLNALTGKGVHIVTVNDYLARRDSEEMGRVYGFLGLKTGLVVHGIEQKEKQEAYAADITYGTNNEFGFDYLRDNMVVYKDRMVQRGHAFAIVDEVDSILIDEARTPLIISGAGDKPTDLYERANTLVRGMKKYVVKELDDKQDSDEMVADMDVDYIVDEKANTATLTQKGVEKAERFFGIENYADSENATIVHHVNQAIKAWGCMHRDDDYVVNEHGVMIVDAFTGRLMPGRRYSNGLHQAIEAKEGVKVETENQTLATITFQNYFRMYEKLAGMTGTALTERDEFLEIYGLDVIEIPTNRPMIRNDRPDAIYKSVNAKYKAIIRQIRECHEKGQPVLVGTISIEKSEYLSSLLKKEGIPHTVLNAKVHEKEAMIVAQAGKDGAVTISTNMAGRGTDIMLGGNAEYLAKEEMRREGIEEALIADANGTSQTDDPAILEARALFDRLYEKYKEEIAPEADKVREAGGLFILGTERHESRRIDNQLRGRSGRQGDPGESRFYLSLEDDLMRLFGSERVQNLFGASIDEEMEINFKMVSNAIERAQRQIEGQNFKRRKYVLAYDDVMNQQRNIIYKQRMEVLNGQDVSPSIMHMIENAVSEAVEINTTEESPLDWHYDSLRSQLFFICGEEDLRFTDTELASLKRDTLEQMLMEKAHAKYAEKVALFGEDIFKEVERSVLLRNVDTAWMEHIDAMDDLKGSVGMQAYAQRNPIDEYRVVGGEMFDSMVSEIREKTVRTVLSVVPRQKEEVKRVQVANPISEGTDENGRPVKKTVVHRESQKIGRNDPCPCGSGKKYKNCCMRKESDT